MRKKETIIEEFKVESEWRPEEFFSNSEIAALYESVEDHVGIVFNYDYFNPEILAIYLLPKGSAEFAWISCGEPDEIRFAMNLKANELFDPKEEGIIFIQIPTHDLLLQSLLKIQEILNKKKEESV